MAKLHQLAPPVMGRATCLHANQTTWQAFEECQNILAPKRSGRDAAALNIDCVNLEDMLGQIEANGGNSAEIGDILVHGRCSFEMSARQQPSWHASHEDDAAAGAVHAIKRA